VLGFRLGTQRFFEKVGDNQMRPCESLPVVNDGDTIKHNMENIITQQQNTQVRNALIGALIALETDIVFLQKDFAYITENRKRQLAEVKEALNLMVFQLSFVPQEVSRNHAIMVHSRAKADLFAE
jgi:hypothetical protein